MPARPARLVDRRPHHDALGAAAGGDEDLLAVQHPLVAVEHGGGAHARRIGAAARLGDRHRQRQVAPLRASARACRPPAAPRCRGRPRCGACAPSSRPRSAPMAISMRHHAPCRCRRSSRSPKRLMKLGGPSPRAARRAGTRARSRRSSARSCARRAPPRARRRGLRGRSSDEVEIDHRGLLASIVAALRPPRLRARRACARCGTTSRPGARG